MYFLDGNNTNTIDSIYAHDPFIISNDGAIVCNMGKKNRVSEIENVKIFLRKLVRKSVSVRIGIGKKSVNSH